MINKTAGLFIVLALAVSAFSPLTQVGAQEGTMTTMQTNTTENSQTTTEGTAAVTAVDADTTKVAERVAGYKKKYTTAMSESAKKRLAERCVASQTKVKTEDVKNENVVAARMQVYTKLITKLTSIIDRAGPQQLDVTALTASVTELQTKVTALEATMLAYRQALTDVHAISCKEDVAGFKASLLAARNAQAAVSGAVKDIRAYMTATIRPQIDTIKTQLEAQITAETTQTQPEQTQPEQTQPLQTQLLQTQPEQTSVQSALTGGAQ